MAAKAKLNWSDKSVYLVLDLLQSRQSLWNTKHESYRNRNIKKREYDEMLDALREDMPDVDLPSLKVKIQSLRTSFREEMRKVKKSKGTGTGAKEVYVSQWKFFHECEFLEEVIISNRPSFSNSEEGENQTNEHPNEQSNENSNSFDEETSSEVDSVLSEQGHPKRKKKVSWMETAATALTELAKDTDNKVKEDEWDVFGRDVANSIRALENKDLQRRVKFSIQTALFQGSEQLIQHLQPQAMSTPNNTSYGTNADANSNKTYTYL